MFSFMLSSTTLSLIIFFILGIILFLKSFISSEDNLISGKLIASSKYEGQNKFTFLSIA